MSLHRRIITAGAGLAAVTVALLAIAPGASAATPTYAVTSSPIPAAAGWLAGQFVDKTHLPAPSGDHFDGAPFDGTYFPSYGENADVIFGLAAAKSGAAKITTALDYLAANVDAYSDVTNSDTFGPYDGSVAKLAVAAIVADADPTKFGGYDLMATLKKDECAADSTTCTPGSAANIFSSISESLVVLAEARVGGASAPTAAALTYLTSLQCANGGFTDTTAACGSGAADIDSTSYAIMALQAAGGHARELGAAVAWLTDQQNAAGYWVSQNVPNANSTGLAAAALQGQGEDVSSARSWLRSQQIGAGSPGAGALKYGATFTPTTAKAGASPSILATAQGLTGLVDGGSLATLTATGASDSVAVFAPTAALSSSTVEAGAHQSVTGNGFVPGEKVRVAIHSTPVTVATVTATAGGTATATYAIPASVGAGAHTVTLAGLTSGLTADHAVTVTAAAAPASSPTTSGSTTTAGPAAEAPIANTGQDSRQLLGLGVAGGLAVLAGAGLVAVGRRRVR